MALFSVGLHHHSVHSGVYQYTQQYHIWYLDFMYRIYFGLSTRSHLRCQWHMENQEHAETSVFLFCVYRTAFCRPRLCGVSCYIEKGSAIMYVAYCMEACADARPSTVADSLSMLFAATVPLQQVLTVDMPREKARRVSIGIYTALVAISLFHYIVNNSMFHSVLFACIVGVVGYKTAKLIGRVFDRQKKKSLRRLARTGMGPVLGNIFRRKQLTISSYLRWRLWTVADRSIQLYHTYTLEEGIGHALEFCTRVAWVVSTFASAK